MNIIFKTDDFWGGKSLSSVQWRRFLDIVILNNVSVSLGFVGQGFEHISNEEILWLKEAIHNKIIEPFNHSYYHLMDAKKNIEEYSGTTKEYQIDSFYRTQKIIKMKLDYVISCVGSPCNSWDDNSIRMISWASDISHIYAYQFGRAYDRIVKGVIPRMVLPINGYRFIESDEISGRKVNYERFVMLFSLLKNEELVIFQLHPFTWNDTDREDFNRVVSYLINEKHQITTPKYI